MTLGEATALLERLVGRERVLLAIEERFLASGQWVQRRAAKEERHQIELRRVAAERRVRALEGSCAT